MASVAGVSYNRNATRISTGKQRGRSVISATVRSIIGAVAIVVVASAVASSSQAQGAPPQRVQHPDFVGAAVCGQCHATELKAWTGSHHQLAMLEATEQSVLGDFSGVNLVHHGIESTFFKRDGKFFVRTDGADGKLADFEIAYTFGVTPLQQYLVAFPGGRLQALSLAWDSRPSAQGGQRWFHLYPNQQVAPSDALHCWDLPLWQLVQASGDPTAAETSGLGTRMKWSRRGSTTM